MPKFLQNNFAFDSAIFNVVENPRPFQGPTYSLKFKTFFMGLQYCAKVTQAKCANFVLCLRELSRKVRAKVRVTIQGLLSEISLEQRTLFRRTFGTKRNFTMTSVISLAQCPKFHVRQTQQFLTRSIRSSRHVTYAKYTEGFQRTL